jgi:uncharacterized protein (DUF58 family)
MASKSPALHDLGQTNYVQRLDLLANQLVEGFITGLHKSPFHGFSVEFAEHRLYNNGESTRHMDWKVYAKSDRLFVKCYEEETNLRCHLVLDTSSSMYYPETTKAKINFSIVAAACLANLLQRQKDAVSLCTFSDHIELQTPVKSTPSHIHKIIMALESLKEKPSAHKKTNTADALHLLSKKIHQRSLVVIFSDMFDDLEEATALFSALQHLKHNKHEVIVFHVTDYATEAEFQFEERPYEFIDLESGDSIKLQPSQVRETYQQKVKSYYHDLYLKCGQYKIDFIQADVAKGIEPILVNYLTKRSKMK